MAWLCVLALPVANSAVLNMVYLILYLLVFLCVKWDKNGKCLIGLSQSL